MKILKESLDSAMHVDPGISSFLITLGNEADNQVYIYKHKTKTKIKTANISYISLKI